MNNLEFDHADIFPDLAAIQRQFHHLMRTVPSNGRVLFPKGDDNLTAVRGMGCWSEVELVGQDDAKWKAVKLADDGSAFEVWLDGEKQGEVHWECIGEHNVNNGLMAIAAARHAGVMVEHGINALCQFKSPKRRMELKGEVAGISVYDDFAHHPTAIETTLGGLRAKVGKARILAVLEPRSNTMKLGVHKEELAGCFDGADQVFFFQPPNIGWDLGEVTAHMTRPARVFEALDALIGALVAESRPGDHILIMSNGGFGGIHDKLIARLKELQSAS
jgi:UDP-N-acetylmuramate: L-alanyl-gamma-D-glutamyl-meso-diaminopimelate ligase